MKRTSGVYTPLAFYVSKNFRNFSLSRKQNAASSHLLHHPTSVPLTNAQITVPSYTPSNRPNPKNAKDSAIPIRQLTQS